MRLLRFLKGCLSIWKGLWSFWDLKKGFTVGVLSSSFDLLCRQHSGFDVCLEPFLNLSFFCHLERMVIRNSFNFKPSKSRLLLYDLCFNLFLSSYLILWVVRRSQGSLHYPACKSPHPDHPAQYGHFLFSESPHVTVFQNFRLLNKHPSFQCPITFSSFL